GECRWRSSGSICDFQQKYRVVLRGKISIRKKIHGWSVSTATAFYRTDIPQRAVVVLYIRMQMRCQVFSDVPTVLPHLPNQRFNKTFLPGTVLIKKIHSEEKFFFGNGYQWIVTPQVVVQRITRK